MIALDSMAVEMPEVEGHPNRAEFRGILTVVDMPSQKAPAGSGGKRVVLTRKAAETALPSLIGMALDYAPTFDRHDARRKVGVITRADVIGRNLEVGGYLFAKDFPDIVEEIARCGRRASPSDRRRINENGTSDYLRTSLAHAVAELRSLSAGIRDSRPLATPAKSCAEKGSELGMSFEVTNVSLLDERARIWTLTGVTFTGAAILRRDKAAYQDTWIELA